MKFKPSWKFYLNVICCLLNLLMFVKTASVFIFCVSILCCFMSSIIWKIEKLAFDFDQEQLKKSFEKQKKEQEKDADF